MLDWIIQNHPEWLVVGPVLLALVWAVIALFAPDDEGDKEPSPPSAYDGLFVHRFDVNMHSWSPFDNTQVRRFSHNGRRLVEQRFETNSGLVIFGYMEEGRGGDYKTWDEVR